MVTVAALPLIEPLIVDVNVFTPSIVWSPVNLTVDANVAAASEALLAALVADVAAAEALLEALVADVDAAEALLAALVAEVDALEALEAAAVALEAALVA